MNDNKIKSSSPLSDLQHQQLLLRMEYEYEKEEFRRQTETMGIARKVKRGLCWYPVGTGRSFYNSLNQLVIEIERKEDKDIEHVFEFGRPVCFFEQGYDGKIHYFNSIYLKYKEQNVWEYNSILMKPPIVPCSKRWKM